MGDSHEEAWRAADNPRHLLRLSRVRPNGRKYLLLACAIVRHVLPGARSEIGLRILAELERFAFAQPAKGVKTQLWREVVRPRCPEVPDRPIRACDQLRDDAPWVSVFDYRLYSLAAVRAADVNAVLDLMWRSEQAARGGRVADLIREVFANPFRPPVIEPGWLACNHGAVKHIAEQIAASGNFTDLPILADALEDAGCRDEELLRHCREERTHLPGCWALDAVLGRG
jgi:hypothetical protein